MLADFETETREPSPGPGRELTGSSPAQAGADAAFAGAMGAACNFLSLRPRSEDEVRRRLTRRFSPELVERVIETLRGKNYLDDEEFARRWRFDRERFHPRGRRLLQRELSRFGVKQEVIDQALEGLEDGENAYQAGHKLAVRLMTKDCTREFLFHKLCPYLQRRCFAYSLARETVNRLWQELAPQPLDGEINSSGGA